MKQKEMKKLQRFYLQENLDFLITIHQQNLIKQRNMK